jgi:hypothetical protein
LIPTIGDPGVMERYHTSLPLFFNFSLQYALRKVQEKQVGLKLNGTHQLLVYAEDVNLLGDSIDNIKKNSDSLTDTSKDFNLKVNAEKTKCMVMSHHHNAEQNH